MVATLKTNILEEVKTLQHQHMQTKAQRYMIHDPTDQSVIHLPVRF